MCYAMEIKYPVKSAYYFFHPQLTVQELLPLDSHLIFESKRSGLWSPSISSRKTANKKIWESLMGELKQSSRFSRPFVAKYTVFVQGHVMLKRLHE
jgi:hypothetical protein